MVVLPYIGTMGKLKFRFSQSKTSVIINLRRAYAARVTVVVLCMSVTHYSRTTGYEATYERYQQLQCYNGILKSGDFAETTVFERYGLKTSEKAISLISTGLPRPVQRTVNELSY